MVILATFSVVVLLIHGIQVLQSRVRLLQRFLHSPVIYVS